MLGRDAQIAHFKSYAYVFFKIRKDTSTENIPLGILKEGLNHYGVHKRERLLWGKGWQTNKKTQLQAPEALVLCSGTGREIDVHQQGADLKNSPWESLT